MCSLIINCYTDWKAIDGSEICQKNAQPAGLEAKKMTTKNALSRIFFNLQQKCINALK